MAESSLEYTLETPAGTIVFNEVGASDVYYLDADGGVTGLDMQPVRASVENKPQTDGAMIHPAFLGAREITLVGTLLVRSASDVTGYVTARNGMEDDLAAALESILRANGTLSFTRTGGSPRSYTVRCDQPMIITGGFLKKFAFGLVSAS